MIEPMNPSICAVVVTHNRQALLRECVAALLAQTRPLTTLLVVDNASSDGTGELFTSEFRDRRINYVFLPHNGGGAGGFRHGIELAHQLGSEWIWLMDDDTIASPTALEELFVAYEKFPADSKPLVLASRVNWIDGTVHPMNLPETKRAFIDPPTSFLAAENATISIRWASFVSVMINRAAVDRFGLPLADYFIWNDDTEFTARVLRENFGILVPRSVVTHKTARKHNPIEAAPERSYYQARNVLWMILRSRAWSGDEKVKIGMVHAKWLVTYLRQARFRWPAVRAIASGVWDGLVKVPVG